MKAIQLISQDLFDKIRSRFENVEMGDKDGGVTIDPAEARFFDFDFVVEGINLGRVSINLADPGRLKIYYSQDITEDRDDPTKKLWYNFLREMRSFAMRRLLRFDTRDISKSNLDKNDFKYLAANSPKDENKMTNMNESRWNHRKTSKTSRAVKGKTEVIVRHTESMNEMLPSSRSDVSKIKNIFVQNKEGERWKCPLNDLGLAFGMAQHVDHGGLPYDNLGKLIINLAQELSQIKQFIKHLKPSSLNSDPLGIKEKAIGRYNELKTTLESLGKRKFYERWASEQVEQDDDPVIEIDQVTFESYKDALTQTNFNENLVDFFPLIHKIMRESNKVNLDDYVKETAETDETTEDIDKQNPMEEFELWAESVEEGKPDVERIKNELPTTPLGPDGSTAWETILDMLGIVTDERLKADVMGDARYQDLQDRLKNAANSGPSDSEGIAYDRFIDWLTDQNTNTGDKLYPELYQTLVPQEPAAEPTQPPAQQPVATQQPQPSQKPAGVEQPVAESVKSNDWVKEVAEMVNSRYNASNESVGPFNGKEGILIDVEKTIKEKYGEKAGMQARAIAEKYIDQKTQEWEKNHGKNITELCATDSEDPLERLKDLVGQLKGKVGNMTDTNTDEGVMDTIKTVAKKAFNTLAPDDATLLKNLERDSGGSIPPRFEPKPEPKSKESVEMETILKLSGLKK